MKQTLLLLLALSLTTAEVPVFNEFVLNGAEPQINFPEQEVKIIPTRIDIEKLREEAYATRNDGERFLPGPSRIPLGLFGEKRKK
ncbi:hypothetical protein Q1695_014140 [Nippostrongylus brasiliensis]|nr:hypothetical protein Q1695_014140 [Nippostrongylus brasiliensis]